MSTFVMSDIHGHYDEFIKMLEVINFQETDELYILGDIIDRGSQSAEMLWFATEEAPANVHFLLGNHEDMMLGAANNYYNRDRIELRKSDIWAYNYGLATAQQIKKFDKYYDGWEQKILDWIDCLPFFYDIEVNGKRFILVHAGLQLEESVSSDWCSNGTNFYISIKNLPTPQDSQTLLWSRDNWFFDKTKWPFDIVCGHTITSRVDWDLLSVNGIPFVQETDGGIVHFGMGLRKHLIDCGVNRGYFLGCLRLEDMQEFYVKGV